MSLSSTLRGAVASLGAVWRNRWSGAFATHAYSSNAKVEEDSTPARQQTSTSASATKEWDLPMSKEELYSIFDNVSKEMDVTFTDPPEEIARAMIENGVDPADLGAMIVTGVHEDTVDADEPLVPSELVLKHGLREPLQRFLPSGTYSPEDLNPYAPGFSRQKTTPYGQRKCPLCNGNKRECGKVPISFKDTQLLSRFLNERGKIVPRRATGICAKQQRAVAKAIKRARHMGLISNVEKLYIA